MACVYYAVQHTYAAVESPYLGMDATAGVYDLAHQTESFAAYDLGHDECGDVGDGDDNESEI